MRLAETLKPTGIPFAHVGTSGGVWGLKEGYSMMIGGEADVVIQLKPIFEARRPLRTKAGGTSDPSAPVIP